MYLFLHTVQIVCSYFVGMVKLLIIILPVIKKHTATITFFCSSFPSLTDKMCIVSKLELQMEKNEERMLCITKREAR